MQEHLIQAMDTEDGTTFTKVQILPTVLPYTLLCPKI